MHTFQEIIIDLQQFWVNQGCILDQPYDVEMGAGTFHPATFFRSLGKEPYKTVYVQPSRRPTDGRYGKNPNRLQRFHQMQVLIKPSPDNIQELYLKSLEAIGLDLSQHDIRFVHDDWESPTQGAWGLGWEVWCDGMEITQFTYFQSIGSLPLSPIPVELAYGLERIAMFLQKKENIFDLQYNKLYTYGEIFLQSEIEWSYYNFEKANTKALKEMFTTHKEESLALIDANKPFPAYDHAVKSSHIFNTLDARGELSQSARVDYMHSIKNLCCKAAKLYESTREESGYPLCRHLPKKKNTTLPPLKIEKFNEDKRGTLLLEIGTEELPHGIIAETIAQLQNLMKAFLDKRSLSYGKIIVDATPRRLVICVEELSEGIQSSSSEIKGPPLSVIFDQDGTLTPQGKGFFKKQNLPEVSLSAITPSSSPLYTNDNTYLYFSKITEALSTLQILHADLPKIITSITFRKSMRWAQEPFSFSRPIRTLLALFDNKQIPIAIDSVISDNTTYAHRQLREHKKIKIKSASTFYSQLRKEHVIISVSERRDSILKQLNAIEEKTKLNSVQKEKIIEDVLFLTESPHLQYTSFDEKYLSLPRELLVSEMVEHQKYFPMETAEGKITSTFVVTLDKAPTKVMMINYNNVLRARLEDAFFLFEEDQKTPLDQLNKKNEKLTFHKKLGSVAERVVRIERLIKILAEKLMLKAPLIAAKYCKVDLSSLVVTEFTDLQGTIGKYLALHNGIEAKQAKAIEEHYLPLSEKSKLPLFDEGALLSLADRFDQLTSYFSVNIIPTSSKDPFALRRQAISIIRILIDRKWHLDLTSLIHDKKLLDFFTTRMLNTLQSLSFSKEEVKAVMIDTSLNPFDLFNRLQALQALKQNPKQFTQCITVFKRASGLLTGKLVSTKISPQLFETPSEKELFKLLQAKTPLIRQHIQARDYAEAFSLIASFQEPLQSFFDTVKVLSEDQNLKNNRLALLHLIGQTTMFLIDFQRLTAPKLY